MARDGVDRNGLGQSYGRAANSAAGADDLYTLCINIEVLYIMYQCSDAILLNAGMQWLMRHEMVFYAYLKRDHHARYSSLSLCYKKDLIIKIQGLICQKFNLRGKKY